MTELWTDIQFYFSENLGKYLTCVRAHVGISFLALLIAAVIGVPLGYLCVKNQRWNRLITGGFQVLRIIPSLAVLILLIPVMGTGMKPAMTALVLLAVPPILMNTTAGFEEVPEFMLETAAGLGMTERQIFWKVKIRMAMPMILTGMKTAAIEIIASATIASKIGAGGLGDIILTGLSLNRTDLLLIGGVSVAVVSLLAGVLFRQLEKIILKYQYV
ncbi:MAG: ABC transporter permease [Bariatricus sp.]